MAKDQATVYFAAAEDPKYKGAYRALGELFKTAKIADAIDKNDMVAIKTHFGELGNSWYVRPVLIHRLVELVKAAGGRPFVTDTTTLYKHNRHDLFAHLENARANGFTPETLGCPVIIADGLKNNGVSVNVAGNRIIKTVNVAQAIYDADVFINAAHLTLHFDFIWAGTLKAAGMGCCTRPMKLLMHSAGKAVFTDTKCINCGLCLRFCPGEALSRVEDKIVFDVDKCVGCGDCVSFCTGEALDVHWGEVGTELILRTVECAKGVISTFAPGKAWHLLFGLDVTDCCDCMSKSPPRPLTSALGLFASQDPAAVDLVAVETMEKAGLLTGREDQLAEFKRLIGESVLRTEGYRVQKV